MLVRYYTAAKRQLYNKRRGREADLIAFSKPAERTGLYIYQHTDAATTTTKRFLMHFRTLPLRPLSITPRDGKKLTAGLDDTLMIPRHLDYSIQSDNNKTSPLYRERNKTHRQ